MRHFVRQSRNGGRSSASNQYYISTTSDEVFYIISKELVVNDKICKILGKFFEYENKHRKMKENDYDSQLKDYRDINQDEKLKYVNDKLSKLPIYEKIQKLNLNHVMMDFDATSLYPAAMWDEKSDYLKIDTGFAFKPHLNDVNAEAFNNQSSNQDGNESLFLKIKNDNPPDLIFQHLSVKKK